jgi:hypothetical protein
MLDTLKYLVYWPLSLLPGKIGTDFETRWYWVRRKLAEAEVRTRFERCLNALDERSICIDLGANIGEIAEMLADRAGHIHAFEPDV